MMSCIGSLLSSSAHSQLGDLNYRITSDVPSSTVFQYARSSFSSLLKKDQLAVSQHAGFAFVGFTEPPISFPPTYKYLRDADLELLASKVGLSSSTLANHLTYNNSKTATEVDAESDTTETTVGNKRDFAARAINEMISDVLAFYGVIGGVSVTWNQSGNNKRTRQNVLDEFNARLMPLREAVKRLHPELTESDVDEWCQRLENENREADVFSDASLLGV